MKYFLLFITFLLSTVHSHAQDWQKPDYKSIEQNIKQDKTALYYKNLQKKFEDGDTSMTIKEKQHLYYGFQFQSGYSPYGGGDYYKSLNALFSKGKLDAEDYKKAILLCDSALADDPFSIRDLNRQINLHRKIGDTVKQQLYYNRMLIVVDAIMSSGDGLTDSTAYYVIAVTHEYDLLSVLGLKSGGAQSLIGINDYLTIAENEEGIKGLYFDVSASMGSLNRMFK